MTLKILHANRETIDQLQETLDRLEVQLLGYQVHESLVQELTEVGYWTNELLQARISYTERCRLEALIERVTYLHMLYLESVLDLRAQKLTQELKDLISDEAWRVYLRLDEVYEMEKEFFHDKSYHQDYNIPLLNLEQEVRARYTSLHLKTY